MTFFYSIYFQRNVRKLFLSIIENIFKFAKPFELSEEIFICFSLNQTTVNY